MISTRVIPCLQLVDGSLVKAIAFGDYVYIGDPANTVRIFNELEVDELCFLDIRASAEGRSPNLELLRDIADEAFMPMAYGGGIKSVEVAMEILSIGFEKVVLNTVAVDAPPVVTELAKRAGSQAVIGSIDVRSPLLGRPTVQVEDGRRKTDLEPVKWAKRLVEMGCGELLVTSMDREGSWKGYDLALLRSITDAVDVPVIANGGCGRPEHIADAVRVAHVSAAAVGSMVVFQKQGMGVLVNFPERAHLDLLLAPAAVGG